MADSPRLGNLHVLSGGLLSSSIPTRLDGSFEEDRMGNGFIFYTCTSLGNTLGLGYSVSILSKLLMIDQMFQSVSIRFQ